jgi:hypothetical protein
MIGAPAGLIVTYEQLMNGPPVGSYFSACAAYAHAHSGLEPISCSLLRLIIVCALAPVCAIGTPRATSEFVVFFWFFCSKNEKSVVASKKRKMKQKNEKSLVISADFIDKFWGSGRGSYEKLMKFITSEALMADLAHTPSQSPHE